MILTDLNRALSIESKFEVLEVILDKINFLAHSFGYTTPVLIRG